MSDPSELDPAKPTEEEASGYHDYVHEQVGPLVQKAIQNMPTILWHYTSGEGLVGILQSGTVWATHVSCVNDQLELRYAQSLLLEAFRKISGEQGHNEDEVFLLGTLERRLTEERTNRSTWFITCFSTVDDDLSQWRAYGLGEGGYSLGFKMSELVHQHNRDGAFLAPVCYDVSLQKAAAEAVARRTLEYYVAGLQKRTGLRDRWTEEFLVAWGNAITYLAPLMKHPKFSAENEWRLVRQLYEADFDKMIYRPKLTLLSRHLPLKLTSSTSKDKELPIVSIRVGPSRNKPVSSISVGDLLRTSKYPEDAVRVLESEVPFQNV